MQYINLYASLYSLNFVELSISPSQSILLRVPKTAIPKHSILKMRRIWYYFYSEIRKKRGVDNFANIERRREPNTFCSRNFLKMEALFIIWPVGNGFTSRGATMYCLSGKTTVHNGCLYMYTFLYKMDIRVITMVTYTNIHKLDMEQSISIYKVFTLMNNYTTFPTAGTSDCETTLGKKFNTMLYRYISSHTIHCTPLKFYFSSSIGVETCAVIYLYE